MKVLQLCHKIPFPASDGGTIAMNNITQGLLSAGHQVKILAIETPKHPLKSGELFENYKTTVDFESVFIDTTPSFYSALTAVFNGKSYQVSRFYSKEFAQKLVHTLQADFDIVHLESIFMTPYIATIRQHSKAKIVLRTHNIEHQIWDRIVRNERNLFKKIARRYFARQLKHYECGIKNKIDAFAAISQPDFQFFTECYHGVLGTVIPFGVNLDDYPENENFIPSDTPELFHVGSMNWLPNVEGIAWFLDDVWPLIVQQYT